MNTAGSLRWLHHSSPLVVRESEVFLTVNSFLLERFLIKCRETKPKEIRTKENHKGPMRKATIA